uniref:C-type lectin domain-containing protein n=1 Tax=Amphiprion percula TaxID=161767 RepID=A0A3P8TKX9_AMPPE
VETREVWGSLCTSRPLPRRACRSLPQSQQVVVPATVPAALCALALCFIKTMDTFVRASVFLWITVGFLFAPEKSEACHQCKCEFVFKNACFEFINESYTWSEARSSCEEQEGELLKLINSPIKTFLNGISREKNTENFTWWVGEGVRGAVQRPTTSEWLLFYCGILFYCNLLSLWLVIFKIKNCIHSVGSWSIKSYICKFLFQEATAL